MISVSATDFETNLDFYFDKVVSGDNVVIADYGNGNVVLISEDEYNELLRFKHNMDK